eukprot:g8099.t1
MSRNNDSSSVSSRAEFENYEAHHFNISRARYARVNNNGGGGSPSTDSKLEKPSTRNPSSSLISKDKKLYKTELCRSWEETGKCRYGGKCQYAHGEKELRQVTRHPKFKTEVCCAFVTLGACPYGRRCRFLHRNVPITALGKQILNPSRNEESVISNVNCITAKSRRLPVFVTLAQGVECSR